MPRNTVAGKAAIRPLNTLNSETIGILIPQRSLWQLMPKLNDYKNCLRLKTPLYLVITY